MPSLDNIFFAFIGWLAGVLSPILADLARERRQAGHIRQGIFLELSEARLTCAITFYLVRGRLGRLDRNDLIWIRPILHENQDRSDCQTIMRGLDAIVELGDDQLINGLMALRSQAGIGLSIRRLDLPFLHSQLGQLAIFNIYEQRHLLDIIRRVRIFNEIQDNAQFYLRKTFEPSITDENRARAVNNYESCCLQISEQAKEIADKVTDLNDALSAHGDG